jgi:nucleoside-diphosphate-sugar epimerase
MKRALVTGAAGFIGNWMVERLRTEGYHVTGIDYKKEPEFGWRCSPHEHSCLDMRSEHWDYIFKGPPFDEVYHFAADMGGIGFITKNHAQITRNNLKININIAEMCRQYDVGKLFFSSSACVYPADRQDREDPLLLIEGSAWPAQPEKGYGLEKLLAEELFAYYAHDYGLDVRVGRFHNIFGPWGTFRGGREKAPAALCYKAHRAVDGVIRVWGDGKQTRSFLYITDCIEAVRRLMDSDCREPINIGSERMVTIAQLTRIALNVAGRSDVSIAFEPDGVQGVRGRNSVNDRAREYLNGWEPQVSLEDGMQRLYTWIARKAG